MSAWLVLAAVLAVFVGAAHSYLGERYILARLFRRGPLPHLYGSDVFTRRTLRFAWHITSVAWWGMAAACCAIALRGPRAGVRALGATFLASAVVTAVGSRGRHLAWLAFLLIAAGTWVGAAGVGP